MNWSEPGDPDYTHGIDNGPSFSNGLTYSYCRVYGYNYGGGDNQYYGQFTTNQSMTISSSWDHYDVTFYR